MVPYIRALDAGIFGKGLNSVTKGLAPMRKNSLSECFISTDVVSVGSQRAVTRHIDSSTVGIFETSVSG